MKNEIKSTCEISFKLNNKEDLPDINDAINDFINIDDDVHISIDKYYEDDNYNYFLVIAVYQDNKHLSKITKLKKGTKLMIKQLYNKKFKVTFIEECDPLKSNDKRGLTYIYFDEEEEPTLMYQECKVWRCDYEQTEIK